MATVKLNSFSGEALRVEITQEFIILYDDTKIAKFIPLTDTRQLKIIVSGNCNRVVTNGNVLVHKDINEIIARHKIYATDEISDARSLRGEVKIEDNLNTDKIWKDLETSDEDNKLKVIGDLTSITYENETKAAIEIYGAVNSVQSEGTVVSLGKVGYALSNDDITSGRKSR